MNAQLLELTDHSLRLSTPHGLLLASPGFATAEGDEVLYGDEARARFRLHPRNSFNRFWQQLSLEPLPGASRHFRHHADMAFGHLSALTGSQTPDSELILSLPGHYSRDQVALLLGLFKHCPVSVAGMVEHGVLNAAAAQHAPRGVFLDMQLHQAVLTFTELKEEQVTRSRVQTIPSAGLLALEDAWSGMVADAFVSQSRFNPRHTAATEQFIHDKLFAWIRTALAQNEVSLEINHQGTLYQATLLRSHFEQKSRQVLTRILRELEDYSDHQLILKADVAELPGTGLWLPQHSVLAAESLLAHAFAMNTHIREHSGGTRVLTSLPSARPAAPTRPEIPGNRHLLVGHRTWALPAGGTVNPGQDIAADAGLPACFELACGQVLVLQTCPTGLEINGLQASAGQTLQVGDRISFAGSDVTLQVIEVG